MKTQGIPKIDLNLAAEFMRAGQAVIFPTETFFGLGSRALDADATARIFRIKHRATMKPLPIILGSMDQLDRIAKVPDYVFPLLQRFWPGPLSIIVVARVDVPDILAGGTGRIAVRLSSHPAATALAKAAGEPITASSANISGRPAVTSADALDPDLVASVSGVLDVNPAPAGGLPSTLVEFTDAEHLRILRDGAISRSALQQAGFAIQ